SGWTIFAFEDIESLSVLKCSSGPYPVVHGPLSAFQLSFPCPRPEAARSGALLAGCPPPSEILAGQTLAMLVAAVDEFGNLLDDYAQTVHFFSTDQSLTERLGTYTFIPEDAGQHSFDISFKPRGEQSLDVV